MALKNCVSTKIIEDVLKPLRTGSDWKVLVVDQLGKRIISSCCKMHQILNVGITLVEDLSKKREPLPTIEAIYLIAPIKFSIDELVNDFRNPHEKTYKAAHVFFTEACPDELFNELSRERAAKSIKTLKELNVSFLPFESQVFSLDWPDVFQTIYDKTRERDEVERQKKLDRCAEQIATLCATLGEYPSVRYRVTDCPWLTEINSKFAGAVSSKLDQYKADDPNMGEGQYKQNTQLILLDRGFDPISPLLHELTYQAMVYDLLPLENDVYRYESSSGTGEVIDKEVILDESDELFCELRHKHIADVNREVPDMLKTFQRENKMDDKATLKDLSQQIKKMPQHQKEINKYSTHISLAQDVTKVYKDTSVPYLAKIEQNMAMGDDGDEKLKEQRAASDVANVLQDNIPASNDAPKSESVQIYDKLRVMALYLLWKPQPATTQQINELLSRINGMSDAMTDWNTVPNLEKIGVSLTRQTRKPYSMQNRKQRDSKYALSRWTPYIKEIMENAISGRLSTDQFPFYNQAPQKSTGRGGRYGNFLSKGSQKAAPRLLVFVVGGLSFSEMRCAYEVSKTPLQGSPNYEVVIGGTHIANPKQFLDDLRNFSVPPSAMDGPPPPI